jgi:hypothetical protein
MNPGKTRQPSNVQRCLNGCGRNHWDVSPQIIGMLKLTHFFSAYIMVIELEGYSTAKDQVSICF